MDFFGHKLFIQFPDVFTPNNDGKNDTFEPYQFPFIKCPRFVNSLTFTVFNRWGKVVFDGSGASNPSWNGRVDGEPAPSEVYTYYIELEVPQCDTPIFKKGDVTLLR